MREVPKQLQKYVFKKGQIANPKGRPKGNTLKEFARIYLEKITDEEKIKFLNSLDPDTVWKMAEGNPHQAIEGNPDKPLIVQIEKEVAEKYGITPSSRQDNTG